METRANYVLIGAVTVLGLLGILGFFLWLAQAQVDRQYAYYDVLFPSVSGLDRAAVVQYNGLAVGQVSAMALDAQNPGLVRVRLEIGAETPVTTETRAILQSQGVTGVSYVELTGGSEGAERVRPEVGGTVPEIPAERSAVQTLVEEAPDLVTQAVLVLRQLLDVVGPENQAYVAGILGNLDGASGQLETALADFSSISRSVAAATGQIGAFTDQLDPLAATVTTTLESADGAFQAATAVMRTAEGTLTAASTALTSVDTAVGNANNVLRDEVPGLVAEARTTISDVRGMVADLQAKARGLSDGLDVTIALAADRLRQSEAAIAGLETTLGNADSALVAVETASDSFDALVEQDGAELVSEARATLTRMDASLAAIDQVIATDVPPIVADLRATVAEVRASVETVNGVVAAAGADISGFTGRLDGLAGTADTTLATATGTLRDASATFARVDAALDVAERTLAAAQGTFVEAERIIAEDAGPLMQDLRSSAARIDAAVSDVADDVPAITAEMRATLAATTAMVERLEAVVAQSAVPIGEFAGNGLPQITRFAQEARNLTADLEQLIVRIERDPARFFLGNQPPEFRR